jgi:hypothetical protein
MPRPTMYAVTMIVIDQLSTPEKTARIRCQATW